MLTFAMCNVEVRVRACANTPRLLRPICHHFTLNIPQLLPLFLRQVLQNKTPVSFQKVWKNRHTSNEGSTSVNDWRLFNTKGKCQKSSLDSSMRSFKIICPCAYIYPHPVRFEPFLSERCGMQPKSHGHLVSELKIDEEKSKYSCHIMM